MTVADCPEAGTHSGSKSFEQLIRFDPALRDRYTV